MSLSQDTSKTCLKIDSQIILLIIRGNKEEIASMRDNHHLNFELILIDDDD